MSLGSKAQYIDFEGDELSTPSNVFDAEDAERAITDANRVSAFVRGEIP